MNKSVKRGFGMLAWTLIVALLLAVWTPPARALETASTPVFIVPVAADPSGLSSPTGAEPKPAPTVTPAGVQASALEWIAVAGVVGGALAGLAVKIFSLIAEVKATVAAHSAQLQQQQGQLNDHALAITPAAPATSAVAKVLLVALGILALMGGMGACTGAKTNAKQDAQALKAALAATDFTASASYDGVTVTGGRVNGRGAVNVDVDAKEVQRAIER